MNKIESKIETLFPSLTNSDKVIANAIKEKFDRIPFLTIHELSDQINASATTISRFVKKLGYASYRDFKYEILKLSENPEEELYDPISSKDTEKEIVNKVFYINIESLKKTHDMIQVENLNAVAARMAKARRLVFVGIGGSGHISNISAQRFLHLKLQAEAYSEQYQMILQCLSVTKKDVVVGISHSGKSKHTIEALQMAKERGAVTVGISNYVYPKMKDTCDYMFCTSFRENKVKAAAISSYIPQIAIIEALYLLTAVKNKNHLGISELNQEIQERTKF